MNSTTDLIERIEQAQEEIHGWKAHIELLESPWIPVSERLPGNIPYNEMCEVALVSAQGEALRCCDVIYENNSKTWWSGNLEIKGIFAWKPVTPLPQPPNLSEE